jgi:hypothetical protein
MNSEPGYGKRLSWPISTSAQHLIEAADKGKKRNREKRVLIEEKHSIN